MTAGNLCGPESLGGSMKARNRRCAGNALSPRIVLFHISNDRLTAIELY
jgi:hypothetical protein